ILLDKLSSYLSELTDMEKFLGGLSVVILLFDLSCYSEKTFSLPGDFSKNLAASLYLPVSSEFNLLKCASILSEFRAEFRDEKILPVVISLCDSIILRKGIEWIGVLPLLHAIKL
uniref:Uncharacterized protein n=1 Tax=Amphimedon queenslandica TaxID=400682 RepID=A0A1X7U2K8_AMPQE